MTCLTDHLHQFILNTSNTRNITTSRIILCVNQNSTHNEIRKSYIKLSKIYHPDKCQDIHATELFRLISQAYLKLVQVEEQPCECEITFEDALNIFFKQTIIDEQDAKLYTKMILNSNELSFKETVAIGYSFYKLFMNNK